jgi:hypothetical protein
VPDIKTIENGVRDRIAELEQLIEPLEREAEQLRQVIAKFGDTAGAAPARAPRGAKPARKAAGRSAQRPADAPAPKRGRPLGSGNRAHQAMATITERPGITAPELAASMGIGPNYLYRVLPRLQREGKLTKRGRGYHPVAESAPAAEGGAANAPGDDA